MAGVAQLATDHHLPRARVAATMRLTRPIDLLKAFSRSYVTVRTPLFAVVGALYRHMPSRANLILGSTRTLSTKYIMNVWKIPITLA